MHEEDSWSIAIRWGRIVVVSQTSRRRRVFVGLIVHDALEGWGYAT